jgi:hypothetical protein
MPKRSRTGKPDVNQMASNLIDAITGNLPADQSDKGKNPAAVALGRLGGLKGGKARAKKLDDQNQWRWISAQEYVRSYEKLLSEARSGDHPRIEPYIQQLSRYDSRFVEGLMSAQNLAEDISIRLLKSGMMKGKSEKNIRKSIDVFLTQAATSSHGRMINLGEAKDCGLNMKFVDLHSPVWNIVWELYVRSDAAMGSHGQRKKLIESAKSAVAV